MSKLGITIAIYGQSDYIQNCINSIADSTKIPYEIHIINTKYPRISVAEAWNIGIEKSGGQFVAVLNDDTLVSDGLFEKMLSRIGKNKNWGIVAPSLSHCVNQQSLDWKRNFWNLKPLEIEAIKAAWNQEAVNEYADYNYKKWGEEFRDLGFTINGCCMVIRKKAWKQVNGFEMIGDYACGEENDFADKLERIGFKSIWLRGLYCHHFGGKTREKVKIDLGKVTLELHRRRELRDE